MANMENEVRKCGNQECQAVLPAGCRDRYCEVCREQKAQRRKKAGRTVLDLLMAPGIVAMKIATRGNRHYNPKD